VECDATGVADPDPRRLALVADALEILVGIGAMSDPDAIPPFSRQIALQELCERRLGPTETAFPFRLAGPPTVPQVGAEDATASRDDDRCRWVRPTRPGHEDSAPAALNSRHIA
jgi:hypothetical protein